MTAKKSSISNTNPIADDASSSNDSVGSESLVNSESLVGSEDMSSIEDTSSIDDVIHFVASPSAASPRADRFAPLKSGKESRSADTASAILAAAALLLPDYGYSRVTIRDLARQSGIGLGTVYGYFRSKEEIGTQLVTQSVEDVHAAMQRILDASLPPLDCLRNLLIARVSVRRLHAAGQRHPINEATPELAAALAPLRAAWRDKECRYLAEGVARGQRSGEISPGSLSLSSLSPGSAGELAQTMLWATDGLVADALHPLPAASEVGPLAAGSLAADPSATEMVSLSLSSPAPDALLLKIRRVADLLVNGAKLL